MEVTSMGDARWRQVKDTLAQLNPCRADSTHIVFIVLLDMAKVLAMVSHWDI